MPSLPFTARNLLAPMEGVTDPLFRRLVLNLHSPNDLGGTFTEFLRVSNQARTARTIQEHLGPQGPIPVGLQLMGSASEALIQTARTAVDSGVKLIDLNFGCPSKGALKGCAGSSLLDDPKSLEGVVADIHAAVGEQVPVTAKLRAGGEDDELLEDLIRAACAGGAAMVTLHARTRREAYAPLAPWERLARAVAASSVPLCGNGGINTHQDFERMRSETGCQYAMVGRAALGNPWIFSGHEPDAAECADFLLSYADGLLARNAPLRGTVSRLKQLLRHWSVGGIAEGPDGRRSWLHERDPNKVMDRLHALQTDLQPAHRFGQ